MIHGGRSLCIGRQVAVFAVIQHHFHQEIGGQGILWAVVVIGFKRRFIGVINAFQVSVGKSGDAVSGKPVFILQFSAVTVAILLFKSVEYTIPFVVETQFRQPLENAVGIFGVTNAVVRAFPEKGHDVITGGHFPPHAVVWMRYFFNLGKTTFDSGMVAAHFKAFVIRLGSIDIRHQILYPRKHKRIAFLRVAVAWQFFIRFALNGGKTQVPAQSEQAVASAGVVTQCNGRHKSVASWRKRQRKTKRSRPIGGIYLELFVNTLDGATAFGQRDLRNVNGNRPGSLFLRTGSR